MARRLATSCRLATPCNARPVVLAAQVAQVALVALAALAAGRVAAGPSAVEIVLNPDQDTYLGEGVSVPQDGAAVLMAGWVYTTRTREYRSYLHFPLDPARHPADGLINAELWLYPNGRPETSEMASLFRVRTLTRPFVEGATAPRWMAAGDPNVERELDTQLVDWKRFPVREIVLGMLTDPAHYGGFEVAGVDTLDNTKFDFISREGSSRPYPDGRQPRLVLTFRESAFATPTPVASATPVATDTPRASLTPVPSPTSEPATAGPTGTPTVTPSPSPTVVPTSAPAAPAFLPRLVRRH